MLQRIVFAGLVIFHLGVIPGNAQQTVPTEAEESGRVETSPLPRVRVLTPSEPGPQRVPVNTSDDADSSDATTPQQTTERPKVIRLGRSTDDDEETNEAEQDGDSRFKQAPERQATFTPQENAIAVPINSPRTKLKNGARLRQLDKMTGQIQTYDISVGESVQVARLRVRLDACRAPGANTTHGTMAFIKVWDTKHDTPEPEFSGWMFAESPALSALDHPRYDLWVINCTTPLGE